MQPHIMRWVCNLLDVALVRSRGVDAVLHLRRPRLEVSSGASQLGGLLSTREDMAAMCSYDINEVSWRQVQEKLAERGAHDQEVDWSDGHDLPWIVWLANIGKIRDVASDALW